jgi:site-specific recombinase XerD
MFTEWFSGKARRWYCESPHRARIDHVGEALLTRRYQDVVVRDPVHEWVRFTRHLAERGLALPASVRAPEVREYVAGRLPGGSATRVRFIRAAIRLFLETDEAGHVLRRIRAVPPPTPPVFQAWVPPYLAFLRCHRGLAETTLAKRAFHLRRFAEFLAAEGVSDLRALRPAQIQAFCTDLPGRRPATRLAYGGSLRSFLRWAFLAGHLPRDLSAAAVSARRYRHPGLPDVLTERELAALLESVDRSTAIGRRDYAVLLLAARYGLRPSDIRQLGLDQIDWRHRRLTLRQAKTGHPLALPLLADVAQALAAYLRAGRPATRARELFVRHRAPFEPFAPSNNLAAIMRTALQHAGFADRPGRRGLALFRHTLATRLLAAGHPLKTIGDILGHRSTDATFVYTKVDLPALGTVALSEAEVLR